MSKIYIQSAPLVWTYSGSLAAGGSLSSGSFPCAGYARLVGIVYSSASLLSPCGLRIWQSCDLGENWDYFSDYALAADSGCGFSLELVGNAARIDLHADSEASALRTSWRLRPV